MKTWFTVSGIILLVMWITTDLLEPPPLAATIISECNQGFVAQHDGGWVICDEGKWWSLNEEREFYSHD
jgi:hypothetical protein